MGENDVTAAAPGDRLSLWGRLTAVASGRVVALALGAYLVLLAALLVSSAQLKQHAPGFTKPDLTFGYDHAAVVDALAQLGEAGREAYALNLVIDTVEPAALALATVLVAARAFPVRLPWLSIAPVTFFVLDLIENVSIWLMIQGFPDVPETLVLATSPVTMVKLVAFLFTVPALAVGLTALVARRLHSPTVRLAAWAIAIIVAAGGVISLEVQPALFTPIGATVAAAWGAVLATMAERELRRPDPAQAALDRA
jgi:hypothetical protein